eukprot:m.394080 g.394080  ORF g.394080 m.394080 type:complete len:249 (+) comp16766_c0_seq18:6643-7389(+)
MTASVSQSHNTESRCPFSAASVQFRVKGRGYSPDQGTVALLEAIGGRDTLLRITSGFYAKMFRDKHLDQFVRSHKDPHAARLADWIAEQMGGGTPWTDELRVRKPHTVKLARGGRIVVRDRQSAHHAAWNSPKRSHQHVGQRFTLQDSRIWMRLMFWSAREVGAFSGTVGEAFERWFVPFIAHYVRIYNSAAPKFAREAARWSLDSAAIDEYLEVRTMTDVLEVSDYGAHYLIPADERNSRWPYESQD